jgi:hypothetical protein
MISITWSDEAGAAQSISFDVDVSETHELTSDVTKHPIEGGADIADHIRTNLDVFSFDAFVSDTPLASNPGVDQISAIETVEFQLPSPPSAGITAPGRALAGAVNGLLSGGNGLPNKVQLLRFPDFKSRMRIMLEKLDELRVKKQLVRVITKSREYDNMAVTSVIMTRAVEDGVGASFSLRFEQVTFLESETVSAPIPAESLGALKKAAGSKATKEDESKRKAELKASILKQMKEGLAEGLGF